MEHTDLRSFPLDTALLVRYCAGETTAQENLWIQCWEQESPHHSAWLAEAREFWGGVSNLDASWNVDAMRTRMLNAIASLESGARAWDNVESVVNEPLSATPERERRATHASGWSTVRSHMRTMVAAGALASVAFIGVLWIGEKTIDTRKVFVEASTYTTPNGQRANVTLPDGSTVSLNVGSRLLVPSDFSSGNRMLRLEGEALFSVNHQSERPFTVIAGASVTKVLGTRFSIRHYDSDSSATVAVQDGKVSVQRGDGAATTRGAEGVVLSARQQLEVSLHGMSAVSPTVDAQFSFVRNRLIIDGKKLRDVIPDLNRWYDADIRLSDREIGDVELILESTGTSIGDLQMVLEETLSLRVARDGRVINISRR